MAWTMTAATPETEREPESTVVTGLPRGQERGGESRPFFPLLHERQYACVVVYVVLDDRTSQSSPFGDAIETFIRREDAERFIEEVRRDDRSLRSPYGSRSAS
jgi:hypothetical protein